MWRQRIVNIAKKQEGLKKAGKKRRGEQRRGQADMHLDT
jgi:hypothetical protein